MRELYRKSWRYFRIRLANLIENKRVGIVMLLLFLIFRMYTKDIRIMSKMTGVSISQYFFTFFLSDYIVATGLMKILILLVYVVVICNVSGKSNAKYYYIIRTGRKAWIFGDILFIIFVSFFFCMMIDLFSVICFLPDIQFQRGWGKIIGTLAYTDASMQYGSLFVIQGRILELYTPIMATLLSFFLLFLGCIVLGLLIYTLNILTKTNTLGIILASFLILLCPITSYMRLPQLYWFSPMSWTSAASLYPIQNIQHPSTAFAGCMLLIIIAGFTVILNACSNKIDVEGEENG